MVGNFSIFSIKNIDSALRIAPIRTAAPESVFTKRLFHQITGKCHLIFLKRKRADLYKPMRNIKSYRSGIGRQYLQNAGPISFFLICSSISQ